LKIASTSVEGRDKSIGVAAKNFGRGMMENMKNDLKHELTTDLRNMFEEIASQLLLKAGNMLGAGKGYSAVARDDDVKSLREGRLTAPLPTGVSKPAGDDLLAENDDVDGSDDEKMSNKEIFASRRGRGASSLTAALAAQQHIVQTDKSIVLHPKKRRRTRLRRRRLRRRLRQRQPRRRRTLLCGELPCTCFALFLLSGIRTSVHLLRCLSAPPSNPREMNMNLY